MSWCWRRSALALGVLLAAAAPCRAQRRSELQVWGLAVASKPAFYGAGLGFALRDEDRLRLTIAAAPGAYGDGSFGARADATLQFLLDPTKRAGAAVYGGGGLSLAAERGHATPYLLLVLGVEHAPGGPRGSFAEVGVGGGVRVAVGYRWRK
jgi:hypothetical protein